MRKEQDKRLALDCIALASQKMPIGVSADEVVAAAVKFYAFAVGTTIEQTPDESSSN